MATKPVTVSPPAAAAAGCTAECESYASGRVDVPPYGYEWTNYQCSATVAGAWAFDRFVVTFKNRDNPPYTISYFRNPTATDSGGDFEPCDVTYDAGGSISILSVEARFVSVRTHLLVNSSNRSTPVQLVYDPATNKLVADY